MLLQHRKLPTFRVSYLGWYTLVLQNSKSTFRVIHDPMQFSAFTYFCLFLEFSNVIAKESVMLIQQRKLPTFRVSYFGCTLVLQLSKSTFRVIYDPMQLFACPF
jgi:hypothetical protein